MVNVDIPKHCSSSPSSYGGHTPHLTINRDATVGLDSTNAFEGPEKLLEVWFCPSPTTLPASSQPGGLKAVKHEIWKEMLDLVNCKILSVIEHDHVDAYLLSESSMFVFPHKLVLKTCGTTTLLCGLPRMLEIAALSAGFPKSSMKLIKGTAIAADPYRVFYSRKNFQFPDQQRGPHRSWREEVRFLDRLFHGGSAYMIGKMNGEHWYLYITGPDTSTEPSTEDQPVGTQTKVIDASPAAAAAFLSPYRNPVDEGRDETLEVLMTDLDPTNARQFFLDEATALADDNHSQTGHEARKVAMSHLGVISELSDSVGSSSSDDFDVFDMNANGPAAQHSKVPGMHQDEEMKPEAAEGHALGTVVAQSCGLADVYPTSKYPDAQIDAYLFSPCGFSANGVVPATARSLTDSSLTQSPDSEPSGDSRGTHYFTIHVTPEPDFSYASFETNVPSWQNGVETADIVQQVVRIFQPGRFSVTIFESKAVGVANGANFGREATGRSGSERMDRIPGYRRVDRIVHDFEGYDLVFRHYEKWDFKGGAPRLGELVC